MKAVRAVDKELSEEEENELPGCPWAVNHQLAGYCFFKYLAVYVDDKTPSDIEIAHCLNVSIETVRSIQEQALQKIRETPVFKELIEAYKGDSILDDQNHGQ